MFTQTIKLKLFMCLFVLVLFKTLNAQGQTLENDTSRAERDCIRNWRDCAGTTVFIRQPKPCDSGSCFPLDLNQLQNCIVCFKGWKIDELILEVIHENGLKVAELDPSRSRQRGNYAEAAFKFTTQSHPSGTYSIRYSKSPENGTINMTPNFFIKQ